MIRIVLSIFFYAAVHSAISQNLVSNYSFENYSTCPTGDNQVELSNGWINVEPTSDYYNCQHLENDIDSLGHTGTAYMGVSCLRPGWSSPYREYVGRYLDTTLTAGLEYYVEIWVKTAADNCVYTDAFGLLFTNGLPIPVDPWTPLLPYDPQIQNQQYRMLDQRYTWQKICGTFIANGTENFLTIGSFKNDDQSTFTLSDSSVCQFQSYGVHWAYVLFDDVLVTPYLTQTTNCPDSIYQKPDNIIDPSGENENTEPEKPELKECSLNFPNVLTANGDGINDFIPINLSSDWSFVVMNRWGELVYYSDENESPQWNGNDAFGKKLNDGTYFYLFEDYAGFCRQHGMITIVH